MDLSWLDLTSLDLSWVDLPWLNLSWLYPAFYCDSPSLHLPVTIQITSRHPPGTLCTHTRHQPNISFLGYIANNFQLGRWMGGWFLLQNHATLWSNLQVCKISSRAEIPKLDRVWQFQNRGHSLIVMRALKLEKPIPACLDMNIAKPLQQENWFSRPQNYFHFFQRGALC